MYKIKINLYYLWKIGKSIYYKKNKCENVLERYSTYLSYYFGNSSFFTRDNVYFMEKFYLNFPIYYSKLDNISWEQYILLLKINNRKERFFYFYLSLFFNSDITETKDFINNNYYFRI